MSRPKKLPRQGRVSIPKRFPMRYQDEVWSLDWTIAHFVLPRLQYFRDCGGSCPGSVASVREWNAILDKMIAAWALIAAGGWCIATPTDEETIAEGMQLFAKYILNLWN